MNGHHYLQQPLPQPLWPCEAQPLARFHVHFVLLGIFLSFTSQRDPVEPETGNLGGWSPVLFLPWICHVTAGKPPCVGHFASVSPSRAPPPSCLLPTGDPLSSSQSPGLSGGATCGCWRWTRGPQVKIKQGDYPACFPAPFPLDSKVALRVKINCLALPTESILTLSRIAYSSSHYTSAASSSSS